MTKNRLAHVSIWWCEKPASPGARSKAKAVSTNGYWANFEVAMFYFRSFLQTAVLGALLFTGFNLHAASESMSTEEIRALQQRMKGAQSLAVDFTQSRTVSIRAGKKSKSSGHAIFARPNKFHWELTKPVSDIMVFDGEVLYTYKPTEKIATRFHSQGNKTQEIKEVIDLILDFDALLGRYQLVSAAKEENSSTMVLKPKGISLIETLEIRIDIKTAAISGIKMTFGNKNTTDYEFTNVTHVAPENGTFAVPTGFKIIDGT